MTNEDEREYIANAIYLSDAFEFFKSNVNKLERDILTDYNQLKMFKKQCKKEHISDAIAIEDMMEYLYNICDILANMSSEGTTLRNKVTYGKAS